MDLVVSFSVNLPYYLGLMVEPILAEGTRIGGRWRIAGLLGEGGFGQVFRAVDESEISLGHAAVKVLHPNTSPLERKVFTGEVQRMAALRHQNLVGYLDSGQLEVREEVHSYLVAEYCQGSLEGFVRSQPAQVLGSQDLLAVLYDISNGLAYLHGKQMIHRDIKPANVLYGDGVWKLGDFGLTRDLTATGSYHRGDNLTGTPLFMAPELFTTMTATAPSDIYAVGVLAHLCATGRPLHQGSGEGLVQRIMSSPPEVDRNLDPTIQDIIYRCCSVDPQQRISALGLNELVANYRSGAPAPTIQNPNYPPSSYETAVYNTATENNAVNASVGNSPGQYTSDQSPPLRTHRGPIQDEIPSKPTSSLKWAAAAGTLAVLAVVAFTGYMLLRSPPSAPNIASPASDATNPTTTVESGDSSVGANASGDTGSGLDSSDPENADLDSSDTGTSEDDTSGQDTSGDSTAGIVIPNPDLPVVNNVDAATHLKSGCPGTAGEMGTLTNDHSAPVDYFIEYEHFNDAGARVSNGVEIIRSLAPGASSLVNFTPFEDGVVRCDVSAISATSSDLETIENAAAVELSDCTRDDFFEDRYGMVVTLTNPTNMTIDAEVYIAVVDDDGVRVDEDWAGESFYRIAPQGAVEEQVDIFFSDTERAPVFPTKCKVIAVEFSES